MIAWIRVTSASALPRSSAVVAVAALAVEAALCRRQRERAAAHRVAVVEPGTGELVPEVGDRALLAARLGQPVDGQPDGDDRDRDERPGAERLEPLPLHLVVGVV